MGRACEPCRRIAAARRRCFLGRVLRGVGADRAPADARWSSRVRRQRLEQQGLVNRERHTDDGRVVLVSLTDAGTAALDDFRSRARAALAAHLAELPDADVELLAAATETLGRLVALLQQGR